MATTYVKPDADWRPNWLAETQWDAREAQAVMDDADGLVEKLGVSGTTPQIAQACDAATSAARAEDLPSVRDACGVVAREALAAAGVTTSQEATGPADVLVYFDGACEPVNPNGVGTYGYVIRGCGLSVSAGGVAGEGPGMTNNVAEYTALGRALRWLTEHKAELTGVARIVIRGDSQLVIHQVAGRWACRVERMAVLCARCRELLGKLGLAYVLEWVPRAENADADALSVQVWEQHTGKPFPHRERKPA